MNEDLDAVLGKNIWLEYFDQNITFERAFTPQYCAVLERHTSIDGNKDWYLIRLEAPVTYKEMNVGHMLIRSRWAGRLIGTKEATSVFIVLVPDLDAITRPLAIERSMYVAWGLAAVGPNDIRRQMRK